MLNRTNPTNTELSKIPCIINFTYFSHRNTVFSILDAGQEIDQVGEELHTHIPLNSAYLAPT